MVLSDFEKAMGMSLQKKEVFLLKQSDMMQGRLMDQWKALFGFPLSPSGSLPTLPPSAGGRGVFPKLPSKGAS